MSRVARAIGAVAGVLAAAWEHHHPTPVDIEPARTYCPICGRPIGDAPHVHEQDVIWPTEETGVMLLTDLRGGQLLVIPDLGAGA